MITIITDPENLNPQNSISILTNYNFSQYTKLAVLNDYRQKKAQLENKMISDK